MPIYTIEKMKIINRFQTALENINPDDFTVKDIKAFFFFFPICFCKLIIWMAIKEGKFIKISEGHYKLK